MFIEYKEILPLKFYHPHTPGHFSLHQLFTLYLHGLLLVRHVFGRVEIDQNGQNTEHQGRVTDVEVCLAALHGRILVARELDETEEGPDED